MKLKKPLKDHDFILLSNGPGELLTWVKPVLRTIREKHPGARVSLVLSPCTHASGREATIAREDFGLERVLEPKSFFSFLLFNKTPQNWNWRPQGAVIFLGGDQAFTWIIAKRLGYKSITYAENDCRWHGLIDFFACQKKIPKVKAKHQHKFKIVGDLTYEAVQLDNGPLKAGWQKKENAERKKQISLLPGSKGLKLRHCLPMMLGMVDTILRDHPEDFSFVIYLAPGLKSEDLENYMNDKNPYYEIYKGGSGRVIKREGQSYIETKAGHLIYIHQEQPAYAQMAQSDLAICTVGTVTKELGKLGVPMVVLTPYMLAAHKLYEFDKWDGLLGLLTKIPYFGKAVIKFLSHWFLKRPKLLAWPNMERGYELVPEIKGAMTAPKLAEYSLDLLKDTKRYKAIEYELLKSNTQKEKPSVNLLKYGMNI